jgi:hypothetical protein
MARTEARIFTSIWSDPDFLSLTRDAQGLYLFLLSQRELSYCGVMPLRPPRWVPKAAGLTLADIERDLKELEGTAYPSPNPPVGEAGEGSSRRPFVITDPDTGEIFIRSLLRRDGAWKIPNLLKLVIDSSEDIASPAIRAALLDEVRRLPLHESSSDQVRTLAAGLAEMLAQGLPNPSANPSGNPSAEGEANHLAIGSGDGPGQGSPDPSGDGSGDGSAMDRPRAGLPLSPIPSPQSPSALPAPAARDRKTGTRLPDDFEDQIRARPDLAEWFRKECPHVNGKFELAQFCDFWRAKPGKDGRKLDWVATWRRWMRTAEDRTGPRQRARPSTTDQRVADAQALKAKLRADRGELP